LPRDEPPLDFRSKFHRFNEACLIHRDRNDEIAINIFAIRWQQIRFGHGDYQVRLSELPAFDPFWRGGQVSGIAFRRPFCGPLLNHADLNDAQPTFL